MIFLFRVIKWFVILQFYRLKISGLHSYWHLVELRMKYHALIILQILGRYVLLSLWSSVYINNLMGYKKIMKNTLLYVMYISYMVFCIFSGCLPKKFFPLNDPDHSNDAKRFCTKWLMNLRCEIYSWKNGPNIRQYFMYK